MGLQMNFMTTHQYIYCMFNGPCTAVCVVLCYSSNSVSMQTCVMLSCLSVCPGVKKYICTCFWVEKAISASSKGQLQGVLTKLILANFINFELGFGEADQRK